MGHEAGSKVNNLVQAVHEGLLLVSQSVVHLSCSLRVTDVENLILTGSLFDCSNVCGVVVHAHFGPGEVPVSAVVDREGLVLPTVLGASVAANPHIVAGIDQLKLEGFLVEESEVLQP